ncbi:zinc finger CCCH domain-containing protein 16 isoform X2 [Spinacia oleracea]|uniref:Zinc finger CCCH domain-containing protein 16 isoform X2 n=1 Tax=Spinacia oleracea TaxID=3562 RepID=A0A9R0KAE7_SPIOL|nr:zinc finger CCCH domain-containing protein 16 isoform X2 [Spinacia oleracea]
MPLKPEPCRNFLRGHCRFGDKCNFPHVTQQQPKPNAFGFGSQTATQSQQQKPNPFGFGVQNSTSGAPNSGGFGQSNSQKPFENKWVRPEKPQNQSQAASHNCTDPDSCKRQIADDFQHESPLWKLTCYGHNKHLPCDISGDISYEELRAVAYDDAKRGTSLPSIVERERGLVNSKKIEFQNLLNNPYTKHTVPAQSNQSPFPAAVASSPSPTPQNNGFSSFAASNQQNPPPNLSFGVRPSTPSNSSGFGQFQGPGQFTTNTVPSGPFSTPVPAQTGGNLPASNNSGFGNSGFGNNGLKSSFGTQVPAQTGGNFAPNIGGFGNSAMSGQGSLFPAQTGGNTFTPNSLGFGNVGMTSQVPVQIGGTPFTSNVGGFGNSGMSSQGSQPPSTSLGGANGGQQTIGSNPQEISATDTGIWLKEEWKLGEIPEQPPPAAYVK